MSDSEPSPTIRRRLLADTLAKLRGKIPRDAAAKAIGLTGTAITRFENAKTMPLEKQLRGLLDCYEASEEQRDRAWGLFRDARLLDWWQSHEDAVPERYTSFFGLETEATVIQTYQMGLVPGLLQTAEYYRAYLLTPPISFPEEEIEKLVAFRMERSKRRLAAGRLHVILDEAVLHRQIGGLAVMHAQVAHIRQLATEHANLTVQVMPFSAGAHHGLDGSFSIMRFPEDLLNNVVYFESGAEGRYLEAESEVERYNLVFGALMHQALSPEDSVAVLERGEN